MSIPEALGKEIRAEAAAQRISLVDLAKSAGITLSTIYLYLDAERDLPIGALYRIADVFRIPGGELVARAESRARAARST